MQQKRHVAHELQDHLDRAVDEPVPREPGDPHRERSSRRASPRPSTEAPVHAAVTGVTAEGRHPALRRSSGPPRPSRPEGGIPRFASCRPIAVLGPSSLGTDQPVVRADAIARGAVAGSALWVRSPVLSALARVRRRYGSALPSARVREFEDGGNPGCKSIALRRVELSPVLGELAQKIRELGVADRNRFRSHPGGGTPTSDRNGVAEPRNGGMPQTSCAALRLPDGETDAQRAADRVGSGETGVMASQHAADRVSGQSGSRG